MLWSPNTQLHYPFQNTALDYSGNARHGTVNGTGAYATKPNGSRCLYFDGVGDYVTTPSFGLTGTVVVFAADIRCQLHAAVTQHLLSDYAQSTTVGFLQSARRANLNTLRWLYADGAAIGTADATGYFTTPFNDTWLHLCIIADYTGKNCYFYRDGILYATVGMTGTPVFPSTARIKYVGAYSGAGDFLLTTGYLQNVYLGTLATMPAAGQMLANVNRLMLGMNPIW